MNILYISYDGALDPLGSSQVLPYLKELSRNGIKFTLLTYEKRKNLTYKSKLKKTKEELFEFGIDWNYCAYHNRPLALATLFDILKGIARCIWIMKNKKIEIVHARGYISSIIALFLKRLFHIKFIFDMRGLWPDEKVDAGAWKKNGFIYKAVKVLEKKFFQYADSVVVLSYAGRKLLKTMYSSDAEISVIPTCVDLNLFKQNNKNAVFSKELKNNGRFVFAYLGSIGSWYMLKEMIDFFNESKYFLNSPLFLFLNNGNHNIIKSALAENNVSHSDYSIKSPDYCNVKDWLSIANASIFFIKPVMSKIVSCPTKFAESLACGLPLVINSGIGDTGEIVAKERVGVIIDEFSSDAYKKALNELKVLLLEGDLLRERCRFVAEEYFSLSKGIDKYRSIYQGLLKL